jgi:shikimate kinase
VSAADFDGRHLVLVGMMGTGKTTIGRILGRQLQREVFDSDEAVEARTGHTVREIFAAQGEPAFRALETAALQDALAAPEPSVVVAAGGVVLSAANRARLAAGDAHVVWLRARPETLVGRVGTGDHRPLLDEDPLATLRAMYRDRSALYAEVADRTIDVDDRTVAQVVEDILR